MAKCSSRHGAAVLHHALVERFAEHFQMAGIQAGQRAAESARR
jgi:hypothetical protein